MRKWKLSTVLFLVILLAASGCGHSHKETTKDPRFAEVDKLFADWDKPETPGCVVGVIENGKLLYTKGYGLANLDYDIPMTPRSVVYIASTSKQFTAACVALLIQKGELSYEDDIRKYFPEIADYGIPIKVKNLIHHTSGISDYLGLMELAGLSFEDYFNNDTALEWIFRQKALNFEPGEKFIYSNSGYVLMAELVKRVSGKTLRQFAEVNIFGPLGMTDSHFNDDRSEVVKNRVISYRLIDEEEKKETEKEIEKSEAEKGKKEAKGYKQFLKNFDAVGDGDLLTTVEDLHKWDQNFYQQKVGGPEFTDLMLTRGKLNDGQELDYAFGLFHGEYKGLKTVSHGGGMLGFRTEMLRFPEQRFTVICLSNLANFDPIDRCKKVADIFLAGLFKEEMKPEPKEAKKEASTVMVDPAILDSYVGKYKMDIGPVIIVTREFDRLFIEPSGQPKMKLKSLSDTDFVNEKSGAEMSFHKDKDSGNIRIDVRIGGMNLTAEKITITPPDLEQLREYVGEYYNDELDTTYALMLVDGKMMVRVRKNPPLQLEMTDADAFASSRFKLIFDRNAENRIAGFTLDAGRVQNLKFALK
ncbi:MAG: serine hydrolase [Candidatus Aminicenantes bacterium]|nr:serine hydrolase [Candidatus Aminicenantes bacterium]